MNDLPTRDPNEELLRNEQHPSEDALAELRRLILGLEQSQLAKLQERLDNPKLRATDISQVLPEAIILRSSQDSNLATALMSTVEEVVKSSIKKDRKTLVDALFPVMGPAIRKAITDALLKMLQSFNQVLENSLSWRGLQWRLEALRTGKSFAEVVLLHSLVYRVEQVFLIHRETGLLLQHVAAASIAFQDADLVSGMLTAIQDFVRDSFGMQSDEGIETIRVGELTVWISRGPELVLAGAVRGSPPEHLRSVFHEALENIHLEQTGALDSFQGDAAPFETSRHHLETCLQAQFSSKQGKFSPFFWVAIGVILVAAGVWAFFAARNHLRWTDYLERIRGQQGIVVTSAEKRHGKYFISGLRDPLAADPTVLLQEASLDPEKVVSRWEPYYALHPEFIIVRAKEVLNPPATVLLELENNILYATGSASHQWITEARSFGGAIPGVTQFRERHLVDKDLQDFTSTKEWVEQQNLGFALDSDSLLPNQVEILREVAKRIRALHDLGQRLGTRFHIEIVGHTDQTGSETKNRDLSQKRADYILAALNAEGIGTIEAKAYGIGAKEPLCQAMTEADKEKNRRVSFKMILADSPIVIAR
jgi:outer membrane protein OmpA-like peptidoglycan-associated protein